MLTVVNPVAGGGRTARLWPRIASAIEGAGLTTDTHVTTQPGEATRVTRDALRAGYTTIVAVGGDGTVADVTNGFFDTHGAALSPVARLGVIPCGRGNDFARTLGLPVGAAAVNILAGGKTLAHDIVKVRYTDQAGRLTSRYCLNVADLGLGGQAIVRAGRLPRFLGGTLTYLLAAIWAVLDVHPVDAEVSVPGASIERLTLSILVVANGRYFGSGMQVAPLASSTDGLLNVLWLARVSKGRLLFDLLPRMYRGRHLGRPGVVSCETHSITITTADRSLLVQIDGDLLGPAYPEVLFTVMPQALAIIGPG